LTACAGGQAGNLADVLPTSLNSSSGQDPTALRPTAVKYQGTLTPQQDIKDAVSGNTLVIVQPWVGLKKYELRETPIYFKSNGLADSPYWIDVAWRVDGSRICMSGSGTNNCYTAYADDTGQAYVKDQNSGLLGRIATIDGGDTHRVREAYEARVAQQRANAQLGMMFAGMLFEAMTTPDVVVCERGLFGSNCTSY
jgi:hypothetical protein